jgi:4'-phosphopantetheinyl transferase EntD
MLDLARDWPDDVRAAAAGLFPAACRVRTCKVDARHSPLFAAEEAQILRAVSKRRQEFSAGRCLARQILGEMGCEEQPLLNGADRAPIWPAGVVGSIAHNAEICIVVVTRGDVVAGVGVDVESADPLSEELIGQICGAREIEWLSGFDAQQRGVMAKMIFCAKEAAFKAQYPLTGEMFGFDRFDVRVAPETGQFEAAFTQQTGPFQRGMRLEGRFASVAGQIVTGVSIGEERPGNG